MQSRGKKIVLMIIVICIAFIIFLVYRFLSGGDVPTEPSPGRPIGSPTDREVIELPRPDVISPEVPVGQVTDPERRRDDRIYTIPSLDSTAPTDDEGEDATLENTPRLVRLFAGRTAGYRIDKNDDGMWDVKVVEQGRGNRYAISTIPYSLNLVSPGEFTKVHEGHIFSDGNTLMLYESADDELTVKSAFVPFIYGDTGERIQLFEDNIRVATNNKNLLFFTKQTNDKTIGLIVNVSNPSETEIIWESAFTNWIPRWGRNKYITLSTPISRFTKGYVYLIDPERIALTNRLVDIKSGGSAFVDTSSGYFILYTTSDRIRRGNAIITDQKRETNISIQSALPEKCDGFNGVFVCAVPENIPSRTLSGHRTRFPDAWYQGDIQLNDSVIQTDAVTQEEKLIMSPDQEDIKELSGNRTFDIIHPRISEDGEFLFFVNKKDFSLWMLKLQE